MPKIRKSRSKRSFRVGLVGYVQQPAKLAEIQVYGARSRKSAERMALTMANKISPALAWEAIAV